MNNDIGNMQYRLIVDRNEDFGSSNYKNNCDDHRFGYVNYIRSDNESEDLSYLKFAHLKCVLLEQEIEYEFCKYFLDKILNENWSLPQNPNTRNLIINSYLNVYKKNHPDVNVDTFINGLKLGWATTQVENVEPEQDVMLTSKN